MAEPETGEGAGALPLLILHHIPRTAGTSLRQVARANYRRNECAWLYPLDRSPESGYREWYASLTRQERVRLRCIASHTANFAMPVVDRPFRAFCLLRDPVERVMSLYRFAVGRAGRDAGRAESGPGRGIPVGQAEWQLEDIYEKLSGGRADSSELHRLFRGFFNGQVRSLLRPGDLPEALPYSPGTGDDARLARELLARILDEHYVVGVQDRFEQSLGLFAESFGWRRLFVPHINAGPPEPTPALSDEMRELIRAHNALDGELYELHRERVSELPTPRLPRWNGVATVTSRVVDYRYRWAQRRYAPRVAAAVKARRRRSVDA